MVLANTIVLSSILNCILLFITTTIFHLQEWTVVFVLVIALGVTAALFYKKIVNGISRQSHESPTINHILTIMCLFSMSSFVVIQMLIYKFSFLTGLLVALIGAGELYALRSLL
jgi:hypothetical protein